MRLPPRQRTSTRISVVHHAGRLLLGAALLFTGTAHLTWARLVFAAQVPRWLPLPTDLVIVGSGLVELALGGALDTKPPPSFNWWSRRFGRAERCFSALQSDLCLCMTFIVLP